MNAQSEMIITIPGYHIASLGEEDAATIQALLEKAGDYTLMVDGRPPSPDGYREILTDLPPGKTPDDKLAMGIYENGTALIGLLDAVRNYPEPGIWWIGQLLVDPTRRGQGLGEAIYHSFETWAAQCGAVGIGLGVVQVNARALRFWQRLGFTTLEEKREKIGTLEHTVLCMRRNILSS